MRNELGESLVEYGKVNNNMVVLDADVSNSTMTALFQKAFPERFFNVGIAEAGMIDTAVGLAMGGKIPFVSAFAAMLCYRGLEQIRTCVSYNNANVKLLAGFAGVSDYKDGATHHSLFDIAVMRSMPNITVVVPADGRELRKMIPLVAEYPGPVYVRISRSEIEYSFKESDKVIIGKGRLLREGKDLTLIVSGTPLHRVLNAWKLLKQEGIDSCVVELHTIKPFDETLVINCAVDTGAIVVVEEHTTIGGLYGAVAELLSKSHPTPVIPVGIDDTYTQTAPNTDTLMDYCGFTSKKIIEACKCVLEMKNCNTKRV